MPRHRDDPHAKPGWLQAQLLGMPHLAGLPEALALAKAQGVRCIAVSNAPRAACECALASLKATIEAAGARPSGGVVVGAWWWCDRRLLRAWRGSWERGLAVEP